MSLKFDIKCSEIAEIIGGKLQGKNNPVISGVNNIEFAKHGEITFLSDDKFIKYLPLTDASCIIASDKLDIKDYPHINFILTDNPHQKFSKLLIYISTRFQKDSTGIHPNVIIDKSSTLNGQNICIGANTVIGKNCRIQNNVIIYPNVTIYDDVEIGEGTIIHSGAVICDDTKIGGNCNILPGAVIGSDGFGFTDNSDGSYTRIPQLGNVIIEDDVEVGANTTIDRALVGSTIIRRGVKLDNLIQIAHNVRVDEDTAMAAQSGVAGSTHVGKRNKFGGQVGVTGHVEIADDVVLLAQTGVAKGIDKKGIYFGSPAKERLTAFRILAAVNELPEIISELRRKK